MAAIEPPSLRIEPPTARAPDRWTLRLPGEVDLATADGVADLVGRAIERGAPRLVLDLTAVEFMDSQGLRALVLAHQALARAGATLLLTGVPPHVESLLELTGLHTTFVRV